MHGQPSGGALPGASCIWPGPRELDSAACTDSKSGLVSSGFIVVELELKINFH
jgi:hypothetical protein